MSPALGRGGRVLGRAGRALGRGGAALIGGGRSTPFGITGPATLPDGVVGSAYTPTTMGRKGVVGTAQWTATGMPPGVLIDINTGVISGIPTAGGPYSVVITLTDNLGSDSRGYSVTVTATSALAITTSSLPDGTIGQAYSASVAAANGLSPYSWSATVGGTAMPTAGLSINPSTGAISGTPTGSPGNKTIVVTVTDSNSVSVSRTFTPNFAAPAITITTSGSLDPATNGDSAWNSVIHASGGTGARTWAIVSGKPSGMSIADSSGVGVVVGPLNDTAGTYHVQFRVTDSLGATDTVTLALVLSDSSPPPPPTGWVRQIGIGRGATAPDSMVTALANACAASTNDRLLGGIWRLGFDWNALESDGDGTFGTGSGSGFYSRKAKLDHIVSKGGYGLAGAFYTAPGAQRTVTFPGTTAAGNRVLWTGGVGAGLAAQLTAAGGRATPTGGNYSDMSIHGPGITGVHTVTAQDGSGFTLDGGVTAGQSGTYTIGGTQAGRDPKMQSVLPSSGLSSFGKFCGHLVDNCGATIKAIELGNETNQPIGSQPYIDVTLQFKQWCHAWVAIKLADPNIMVISPGTANSQTGPPSGGRIEAPDFYDMALDAAHAVAGTNCAANYFADLCSAHGLGALRTAKPCPLLPWDATGFHAYTVDPLKTPNSSFDWCAYIWNQVKNRGGGGSLPIAFTEEGPAWWEEGHSPAGNPLPASPTNPRGSFLWTKSFLDLQWGNIRWPHAAMGGLESTSLSLTQRRALAATMFIPPNIQWLQATAGWPSTGMWKENGDPKFDAYALGAPHTTISGAQALPKSSILVASTTGFKPTDGWLLMGPAAGSRQTDVHYDTKDGTHFLGCTGGTGSASDGWRVTPANSMMDALIHADG